MTSRRSAFALLASALIAAGLRWSLAQEKAAPAASEKPSAAAPRRLRDSLLCRLFHRGVDRRLLAEGYRAVPILVNEYSIRSLRAGDRVDVLSVFDAATPDGRKEKFAATLLQHAKVVGVDHAKDPKGQGTLHLLLNPLEAQYAALAISQGELLVVLRKEGDRDIYPMEMSVYRKLFR